MNSYREVPMRRAAPRSILLLLALSGCATTGGMPGRAASPTQVGIASYYDSRIDGATTASGESYDGRALTAAHPTLPFGTRVRVTNLRNDRSVVVTINDRGPFARGRIIDLSLRAARELGFVRDGTARVRVQVVSR
jgi:rare lipoprotein A